MSVRNKPRNKPRQVEFRGAHPFFQNGKSYTYKQYSDWTIANCMDGGVLRATIKGRLYGEPFCTVRHLSPKRQFTFEADKVNTPKARRWRISNQPMLESKIERLSMEWLKKPPVSIDHSYDRKGWTYLK